MELLSGEASNVSKGLLAPVILSVMPSGIRLAQWHTSHRDSDVPECLGLLGPPPACVVGLPLSEGLVGPEW